MSLGAFRKAKQEICDAAWRDCAIENIRALREFRWGERYEPTEEEIQAMMRAMDESPKVIVSYDPGDP